MEAFIKKAINNYDDICEGAKADNWDEDDIKHVAQSPYLKDKSVICPVCGKKFTPAAMHVYKHYRTKARVCTYSCAIKSEKEYFDGSTLQRTPMKQRIEAEIAAEDAKKQAKRIKKLGKINKQSDAAEPKRPTPVKRYHPTVADLTQPI